MGSATYRLMESYKDDYPDHAQGILQEAIQNSIDARLPPKGFKDVVIVIKYDREARVLRVRDYGTTGMPHCERCDWGIKIDSGEDCHEKDCKWGNFHYLGGLAKDMRQLGYRGQGKSLAVVAGERLVVRTKVAHPEGNHISMASELGQEGDECYWDPQKENAMEPTDKPGTELTIYGVDDAVHRGLSDRQAIKGDIQRTWFPALQKGVRIRFGYAGGKLSKINPPHYTDAAVNEAGKPIKRRRRSIPVSVRRKVVGELTDVEFILAKEPLPEDLRGIALIRNGTQVIERQKSWGRKIPLALQDRFYGWATYYTTEDRPFLRKCEKPGHRGYRPHPYYRRVKDLLLQHVEDFLLPFAEQEFKPKLTEKDRRRARQNLQIIQKALAAMPEFNPWSGEGIIPEPPKPPVVLDNPYITSITLDKESYEYGETAKVEVVILNPTKEHQPFVHLTVQALDEGLSRLAIWELSSSDLSLLKAATETQKGRILTQIQVPITEDFGVGRNWIHCTLFNRPPTFLPDSPEEPEPETLYDRQGHGLWVGEVPQRITRRRKGGGPSGDGKSKGTLARLNPITAPAAPLDPVENEIMPIWQSAEIWFYTKGARIVGVYESEPRAADSILYELVAEAIAERITELRMEEDVRESLDRTQVIDEFRRIEELRKGFLRSCEHYRAGM